MATLTAFNTISNTTIADGDALGKNIDIAKSNDNAMLSETISTYDKANEVYDTVSSFSAKEWLNTNNKNFSEIIVNDAHTAKGSSRLGSKFTISAGDHIVIDKVDDAYRFSPDGSIANVSSYFKYAHFNGDLPINRCDPFTLQCEFAKMNWGAFLMHDKYVEYADGFVKTDCNYKDNLLLNVGILNNLGYSATTRILTSADLPYDEESKDMQVLSHTVPKHGSFLYAHYDSSMPYRGAAVLDRCSISLSHNNFVTDYSISLDIKGSSASNHSFIMGNDTLQLWGSDTSARYILSSSMIATNSSTCFGPGSVVNDKSLVTIPYAGYADTLLSATNRTIGLVPCNSLRGSEVDNKPAIADKSVVMECYGRVPFTARDSILIFSDKISGSEDYGATTFSANRTLGMYMHDGAMLQPAEQKHDNSVELISFVSNAKDSVILSVKGSNDNQAGYTVNNSLLSMGQFYASADATINKSCLIGFAADNKYTTTYNGCYTLASPVLCKNLIQRNINRIYGLGTVTYDFDHKNTLLLTESNPIIGSMIGYSNLIVTRTATAISGNGNLFLKGSHYYAGPSQCYNNFIMYGLNTTGVNDTVVDDNEIYCPAYNLPTTAISACYIGANSVACGPQYYSTLTTIEHTVAAQHSSAYSNNSLALCYGKVNETYIYTGGITAHDTSKNYCLSLFNSTATKTTWDAGVDDRTQLVMWKNTLKKRDLPKHQFSHVTEIDDITTLEDDIYYIIG